MIPFSSQKEVYEKIELYSNIKFPKLSLWSRVKLAWRFYKVVNENNTLATFLLKVPNLEDRINIDLEKKQYKEDIKMLPRYINEPIDVKPTKEQIEDIKNIGSGLVKSIDLDQSQEEIDQMFLSKFSMFKGDKNIKHSNFSPKFIGDKENTKPDIININGEFRLNNKESENCLPKMFEALNKVKLINKDK